MTESGASLLSRLRRGLKLASPADAIAAGDRSRDARNWVEAARHYRHALELQPQLAGIWVQLGHMLKESGKRKDALRAYQKAASLEPHNSDTALQLGHVLKLLNQRKEAARWYACAAAWPPQQPDALRELSAIIPDIEQCMAMITAEQIAMPSPAKDSPLFWDVSGLLQSQEEERHTAIIWFEIGLSQQKLGHARLVARDPQTSTWRIAPSDLAELPAKANILNWQLFEATACMVVTHAATVARLGDQHVMALRQISGSQEQRVVLYTGLAKAWAFAEAEQLGALDSCLRMADACLFPSVADARQFEGRAQQLGLSLISEVLEAGILIEETDSAAASGESRKHICLTSADDPNLPMLLRAAKAFDSPAAISFLPAVAGDEAKAHLVSRIKTLAGEIKAKAGKSEIALSVSAIVSADEIATAASVTISKCGPEAEAIALIALRAGVAVSGSHASGLYSALRPAISTTFTETDEVELCRFWRTGNRPRAATMPILEQRGHAFFTALRALQTMPDSALSKRDQLIVGEFIDFSKTGRGIAFRKGNGWSAPSSSACEIGNGNAELEFQLMTPLAGRHKLALYLASAGDTPIDLEISVRSGNTSSKPVLVSLPRSAGWVTQDFTPSSSLQAPVAIEFRCAALGNVPDSQSQALLGGMIIYPADRDHLWFEFLEAASRGDIPAIQIFRLMRS